jgi:glycosyltransferase involved in cell wall biosynthesis
MVEKKKKIWLVNQDAMPPNLESRLRTIKFAHYLTNMGYDVTIFASSIMHNMNIDLIENRETYIEKYYGDLKFVFIKTRRYNKNGLARLIGLIEFPLRLHFLRKKFVKPDVFIHTANIPFDNLLFFTAKKLRAFYIVEILDLWPQTFVDLGLLSKNNPIMFFSYLAEKWLYKKADKVVFSMEGGRNYVVDKKWDKDSGGPIDLSKVHYINNGVDLKDFYKNMETYRLDDCDLENDALKKIIYMGAIRLANNLNELIRAAEILSNQSNIKFLIYGDGDDRESLIELCKEKNLLNVIFKQKWIDPQYVPYVLSKSTVNILNYKSGDFGKYGGSQSKMFQYFASGNPICSNLKMMYCLINKHHLGIAKVFDSSEEYAQAILTLANLDQKSRMEMKERAQIAVKEFDYEFLAKKTAMIFENHNFSAEHSEF